MGHTHGPQSLTLEAPWHVAMHTFGQRLPSLSQTGHPVSC